MTNKEAIEILNQIYCDWRTEEEREAIEFALKALCQEPIDRFTMLHEIYMEGVNIGGEYQGCWVRFKDIEKIVDKYIAESEDKK